jgi:hypothetical protein
MLKNKLVKTILSISFIAAVLLSCSKNKADDVKPEKVYARVTIFPVLSPGPACPPCYLVGFIDSNNVTYRAFKLPTVPFPAENPAIVKILYHDTAVGYIACDMHSIVIDDMKQ